MGLIDSHCHLDFPVFDQDRDSVVARARSAGVTGILIPGVSPDTWDRLLGVRDRYGDLIRVSLGIHPHALTTLTDAQVSAGLSALEARLLAAGAVAVGECGLDGSLIKRGVSWERQEAALIPQLDLAKRLGLPVLLHCVKAHGRLLALLEARGPTVGVLHAYSGSVELVNRYAALGLYFGFGGALTWHNARRPLLAAAAVPLNRLLVETDAPDMPPHLPLPVSGRNEPMMVAAFAERLERLRGEDLPDNSGILGFGPTAR